MSERFQWVSDLTRGEWLRPMESESFNSILSVVPRGFEAYARVFHPVERDRPRDTNTWNGVDTATHFDGVDDIAAALETQRIAWAQVAAAFGTTMHAEAQYARLVGRGYGDAGGAIDADGWRYSDTLEGCLEAGSLTTVSAVLARHTTTPDAGIAAIWEGWGGLVSSACAVYVESEEEPRAVPRYTEPGPGLLSSQISAGPRFDLHGQTGRHYILFEAGANDFEDSCWPNCAPWVGEVMWAQSPSLLWPDDHSWVLATEIDFDSTLIAGTTALIRELIETPGLEALPIRSDADLTWDGDRRNRRY